jgi:hypothetical protein
MWMHLAAGAFAYAAFVAGLVWRGYRWQSVKPTATTAPPAAPTADHSPEEGNHA